MLGIFLDIETTGLNSQKHRAIELAMKFVDLYSGRQRGAYESVIYQPKEVWDQSDPNSLLINGFTWGKVSSGLSEAEVAQSVTSLMERLEVLRGTAVYICQNPSFDRVFFSQLISVDIQEQHHWPYHWLDLASMYWALNFKALQDKKRPLYKDGLSKDEIAHSQHLPKEVNPHRAMNGVDHLLLCYQSVVGFPSLVAH